MKRKLRSFFFFGWMNRFLPTKRNMNCWKLDKEIKKSVVNLIERRKDEKNNSGGDLLMQEKSPKDLLGLMIQASKSCPSSNITVHDIVEECKSFFFAGKQTTSNLMTWTTVLLAMHPHWQVQAREEVLRVCGSRDVPSKDDVVKLKTVSYCICMLDISKDKESCFCLLAHVCFVLKTKLPPFAFIVSCFGGNI